MCLTVLARLMPEAGTRAQCQAHQMCMKHKRGWLHWAGRHQGMGATHPTLSWRGCDLALAEAEAMTCSCCPNPLCPSGCFRICLGCISSDAAHTRRIIVGCCGLPCCGVLSNAGCATRHSCMHTVCMHTQCLVLFVITRCRVLRAPDSSTQGLTEPQCRQLSSAAVRCCGAQLPPAVVVVVV